ncbi:hypothetical protein [Arthrobacter sp. ISL-30]|uniref:hypothetical protein n=1 Tax=Arthrobacter sp. ISL-30 TaxID=2819109 RepID=UPI001BEC3FEC|nr:hypothetical protein [Arthrobacter sp. ISL-30]MBT2514464.1 hypothetical protein [Arthrobacter sp. ISL-30]
MLFGELGPRLRPLSRRLATAGWLCAAVGVGAGLAVAVASGVRLSAGMQLVQATSLAATIAAGLLLSLAAVCQPPAKPVEERKDDEGSAPYYSTTGTHVGSFLLASVAMLLAVVGFSLAGLLQPGGPSAQSSAFSQIFLLGGASCGLTFLLLHKAAPPKRRSSEE